MKLSIIVPCWNEEACIPLYYEEVKKNLSNLDIKYELIFINDGSKDNTMLELKKLYEIDKNVIILDLSRNFGKESAMYAGLKKSSGDYVVIMDADLQDPPYLLEEMINILNTKEYDSVATRRVDRKGEPPIRSFFARTFYRLINKMMDKVEIVDGARDYRMMTRQMVDSIVGLEEYHRFSKGLFAWVGYRTKYLQFENVERIAGETSWSFFKLFLYAIEGIVSFTTAPLRFATFMGIITSGISFVYMIYTIIITLINGNNVNGYASTVSIILFIGGIQLVALGIIGEYLSRTYMEVKKRPIFIVKECIEHDKKNTK